MHYGPQRTHLSNSKAKHQILQGSIYARTHARMHACMHTHKSVLRPSGLCPGLPGEPVPEPIWILLKQETVSGSGIS